MRKLTALCLLLCLSTTMVTASTLSVVPLAPISGAESDYSIGTSYSFYGTEPVRGGLTEDYAPYANAAGSRYDRIDFSWNRIETSPDVHNFSAYDIVVSHDNANDLELIGILMSTADWASANCPATASDIDFSPDVAIRLQTFGDGEFSAQSTNALPWCPYPPDGLDLPWNDPNNHWGDFVYDIVSHYNTPGNPHVDLWEVWNEPDWNLFWRGSKADYAQLLKVAYQATKAANPDATVLFGGLFYWIDTNWYKDVMTILPSVSGAATNNYYFDALSLHQYSNIYNIRPVVAEIDTHMAATVGDHPVWITETGVPLCEEPGFPQVCDAGSYRARADEAGYYAIEAYTEAQAAGAEKFVWFRMHDEYMTEAFGLMRNDYTFRPAYPALQVAARYLHGENQITGPLGSNGVRRYSYWGTPRGLVDVLWNTSTGTITTTRPAFLPTATLVNYQGITQTLVAVNGTYTLTLPGTTTFTGNNGDSIIGGPPLLLIQEDTVPPESSLDILLSVIYSDTVTLSWDVTDDAAGYWYAEIEQARDPLGPWSNLASWGATNGVTSAKFTLPDDGTWYFRMRARDRVGNWEQMPSGAETQTTLVTTRTVSLDATTYIDSNGNGIHDSGEMLPATAVKFAWRYASGTPIAGANAQVWHYNTTIDYGPTVIIAQLPGYLPAFYPVFVKTGQDTQHIVADLPLRAITSTVYLPSVSK